MSRPERFKRILRWSGVFCLLFLALFILFFFQSNLNSDWTENPRFNLQAILLAIVTVFNFLLLVTLVILLARYVMKSVMERKGRLMKTSVKTKLILAFTFLSFVPTGLYVLFSYQIIHRSLDLWFSSPAEHTLRQAEELAQNYYSAVIAETRNFLDDYRQDRRTLSEADFPELASFRAQRRLDVVLVTDETGAVLFRDQDPRWKHLNYLPEDPGLIQQNARENEIQHTMESHPNEDVVLSFVKMPGTPARIVTFGKRIPGAISYRAFLINEAYKEYFQLRNQMDLIRWNHFFVVGLAGLVIFFCFIYLGIYVSKKITVPVQSLVEGSRRLAAGDLTTPIECEARDEFDELISSFNQMMVELRRSREELEAANAQLQGTNQELERRNSFIQTVLDTIATGVVSLDDQFIITSSNASAAHLLQMSIQDGSAPPCAMSSRRESWRKSSACCRTPSFMAGPAGR
jgi:two-component system, NtrC family, nitrogen regulation sensor histidine kinase NtrY